MGHYPLELFLIQNTHMTLTEANNLSEEEKLRYIFYIEELEKEKKQAQEDEEARAKGIKIIRG